MAETEEVMLKSQARREVLQVLGLLACAREPLTLIALRQFFGPEDADRMEDLLTVAADFFGSRPVARSPDAPFRFFHSRFQEFILEEAADLRTALHARIANACLQWRKLNGDVRIYALRYLPTHLHEAQRWDTLCETLNDLYFIEAKCSVGAVHDLVSEYDRTLEAIPISFAARRAVQDFARFVRAQSHIIGVRPKMVMQQAANEPDSTAPSREACRLLKVGLDRFPWLRWVNKSTSKSRPTTLLGHNNSVSDCCFSPDGELLASSGYWDETIRLWDRHTGRLMATLVECGKRVETCLFSRDGKRIISGQEHGPITIWSVEQRKRLADIGRSSPITACTFSADGNQAVSGARDGSLKLWNLRTGGKVTLLTRERSMITCGAFSPDSRLLLVGLDDGTVKLFDLRSQTDVLTLTGHGKRVTACTFSNDGRHIASGTHDGSITVWDIIDKREVTRVATGVDSIAACSFLGKEHFILAAHVRGSHSWSDVGLYDFIEPDEVVTGSVRLWNTVTGAEIPLPSPNSLIGSMKRAAQVAFVVATYYRDTDGNNCVGLWEFLRGRLKATSIKHIDHVSACAVSANRSRLLSGDYSGTLTMWSTGTGEEETTLERGSYSIAAWGYSPGTEQIVTCHTDDIANVWDAETGAKLVTIKNSHGGITSCSVSTNGTRLAIGFKDGSLDLLELPTGAQRSLDTEAVTVSACAFSPDASLLAIGLSDGTIKLWAADTGKELSCIAGQGSQIESLVWSPDGSRVLCTVPVWDAASLRPSGTLKVLAVHRASASTSLRSVFNSGECLDAVCWSPDGDRIVVGASDNTLKIIDAGSGKVVGSLHGHSRNVSSCSYSHDGLQIASASDDKTVKLWDATDLASAFGHELSGHLDDVKACAFSLDGRYLLSASYDKTLGLWDGDSGVHLAIISGATEPLNSCHFSPDCAKIIVAGGRSSPTGPGRGILRLWDLGTDTEAMRFEGHEREVGCCDCSPDGTRIFSVSQDRTVRIWDAVTGKQQKKISITADVFYTACACSPDGRRVAAAYGDKCAKIWSAQTGEELATLEGHSAHVVCCAFSPDSERIVTGSEDKTVRVWDVESGQPVGILTGHSALVTGCVFSPDGEQIGSVSMDQTLRIWTASTGLLVSEYVDEGPLLAISWSPSGSRIAVSNSLGALRLLSLENAGASSLVVTMWRSSTETLPAFLCPDCLSWHEVSLQLLGAESNCPRCNRRVRFNKFTTNVAWPRVAEGLTELKSRCDSISRTGWLKVAPDPPLEDFTHSRLYLGSTPHPAADPERAARLNIEYQRALARRKALPWWRRWWVKRPNPPSGI